MITTENPGAIPADIRAQLEQTLADLAAGKRDPEKMAAACRQMDEMREANRRLFGEQNIAVELIREARDRQ
jgi:hypothetical protein